ncbi:hypothetical protein WJX72_011775 [[Myrmecia] bisecta]|uniref:Uncharacterized protein n=1 Tax=[Myrmecia] bisecta TaxID=41462 RepID=A0AAW1QTN1_9CHLO
MQSTRRDALQSVRASTAPNWTLNTLGAGHRGRAQPSFHPAESLTGGLAKFFAASEPLSFSPRRHHRHDPPSTAAAEPHILNCNRGYYVRRQANPEGLYHRHRGSAPPPTISTKHDGKRFVEEPKGLVPRIQGMRQYTELREKPAGQLAQEPQLHHIRRYPAREGKERSLEESLHRKIAVTRDSYYGTGRAGDLSKLFSPPPRVEDIPEYQHHCVESPTFLRYCKSLPPRTGVSPLERHMEQLQEKVAKENRRALEAVLQLEEWEVRQAEKLAPIEIKPPAAGAAAGKTSRMANKS